jgi:hypothetical protein
VDAYATQAEAVAFLADGALDGYSAGEVGRLLMRASEVLDDKVRRPFAVDGTTFLPTDASIAAAMSLACCAQIEFWLEVGEDHDVSGLANRGVAIGHLRVDALPPELGPRAKRILNGAGLLSGVTLDTTAERFFASQSGA